MTAHANTAEPLKIALVGCGKMGLNHVKGIAACGNARLVAAVDPAADQGVLKQSLPSGVRLFSSTTEMLETVRPDVVHVVTPPATHTEIAKLCLSRGAHVYVEKPFAVTAAEAAEVLDAAERAGKLVCAGHQLLFEKPARALVRALPVIDRVVHIESYFAFRTVRKSRDGRSPMSPVEQLLDILPHPVYTMLDVLRRCNPASTPVISALEVRAEGEVRALLRSGDATAVLTVTLHGRPIESYLRVVGTNGSLRADFVRGTLLDLPGAGTSAVSIMLNPYREARQVALGSTIGFASRILEKKKGYPGLRELFDAFYDSVRQGSPSPLTRISIVETVGVCEHVGRALREAEDVRERQAERKLETDERELTPVEPGRGVVLVTGGSGMLGGAVVSTIRQRGWAVRSISRRVPPPSRRQPGVEYAVGDLSQPLDSCVFDRVTSVVHCAAETAGGKEAHDRNTIGATRNVLQSAAAAGVKRFVHVSSIAVLKPSKTVGSRVSEQTPVDQGNLARGPYVWAKAEAEREVVERGPLLGLSVRIVRPGPLVDFKAYEPPGRLGRELGPVFLAVGPRAGQLSLCEVSTAAQVIRTVLEDFESAPPIVNLVEPEAPTRAHLLSLWLSRRPDLKAIWLPSWVLSVLSPVAKGLQRVVLRRATPIDLAAAFSSERYDASLAAQVIRRAESTEVRTV
jgi:predicted dehydrogenase/nucleoside-diphosphate-sugar epimerase